MSAPVDALDKSLREAEVMERNGYPYVIHPLMDGVPRADPQLLQAWVDWCRQQGDLTGGSSLLLAPEAMGLPLVAPLSLALGKPYVIARKRRYDLPGEEVAYCETGYGQNCLHLNDLWPDDRFLFVDDVFSTGGTLNGILTTLKTMRVPVAGVLIFLDKGDARARLEEQHGVPIRCMRRIRIAAGKVEVVAA
jgi:adenine phosphoribosyltransferase